MKKKHKVLAAVCVVCMMILGVIIPLSTVYADERVIPENLTSSLDFITRVELADRAGTPFAPGDNIAKDAELRLTYEFEIPNTAEVIPNDTFNLPIPDEILLTPGPPFDLVDDRNSGIIATVSYVAGGLLITFTDHAQNYSEIKGLFYMELAFDENEIGNDDPTKITFDLGGVTAPEEIYIDFDQPPPPETSVQKTGSYDPDTREIEWTVTVNSEAVVVTDAVLVDDIPAGLTFVPGSVTIGGVAANPIDYTYSDPTLTYTFPSTINNKQVVKFKTTVDESEFISTTPPTYKDDGDVIVENNQARLNYDGTFKLSNEASINVDVNHIEKDGTYNEGTKQIAWEIDVNLNDLTVDNAVLSDTIPAGLTYVPGTFMVYNKAGVQIDVTDVAVSGQEISYNFGNITERRKVMFTTDVDVEAYEQNGTTTFDNTATFTGDNMPAGTQDGDNPGVNANLLTKNGIGYNRATREITWEIHVNQDLITINNAVLTDSIPAGQTFVPDSVTVKEGSAVWRNAVLDSDYSYSDPTITYTLPAIITEEHIVRFRTTVDDPDVYAANRNNVMYHNAVTMTSNLPEENDTGDQDVDSNVINKSNQGYNYQTREIDWRIVVNSNNMVLPNAVVTDNINVGMEYVAGSFEVDGTPVLDSTVYSDSPANPVLHTGTLTYDFGAVINTQHIITFKTYIPDTELSVFETNGDKIFSNSATITTDLVPTGVTNSASQTVHNTVIGKSGDYTTGNTYIDWTISVNTNDIPLVNGTINDQLQEGLALDTATVKLYHATVNASNGSLIQGAEVTPLTSANVIYNVDTRLFNFNIPAPVVGGYILKFRTYVTDKSKSPFTNSASFNGSGEVNTGSENPIAVAWAGSGSSGTGDIGSMDVIKVDRLDNRILLQGAEFELEDKYGNIVQRMTSDASGSALFGRLRFDVDYTVREITPPTGYVRSTEEHKFQISSALTDKNISYNFVNDRIYGSIEFMKYGDHSDPLEGAIFTLYDSGNSVVTTATSGADGVVLFESIQYGAYTIKETTPPEGYLLASEVLTASVTEYGVTVTANPESISNTVITGNIQIKKLDDREMTPLEGASLSLFTPSDTMFSSPIDTQVSAANGVVLFEDVPYGSYVIKETAAPTGYNISDNTVNVTVSEQDVTVNAGTYLNSIIRSTIEVLKRNIKREPLQGAIFTLYNNSGIEVTQATSGSDGIARFENVPYGNYTVKETTPPHMYLISDDVMVANVLSGEMVKVISTDERSPSYPWPIESPKTGDGIELYVWIFALSFLLLVWIPIIDQIMKRVGKHSKL